MGRWHLKGQSIYIIYILPLLVQQLLENIKLCSMYKAEYLSAHIDPTHGGKTSFKFQRVIVVYFFKPHASKASTFHPYLHALFLIVFLFGALPERETKSSLSLASALPKKS